MKKKNPWIYILFGVYPISLFALANSKFGRLVQLFILMLVTSLLLLAANVFQVLNIVSALLIILFVFTPYYIGKQIR